MKTEYRELVRSGIYGVFVGDAVGVPAEFRSRGELADKPMTDMIGGGVHAQPIGTWSDDSSMTLCLMESITKTGGLHTNDIMNRFLDWMENGAYSPWGECFDRGHTVYQALERFKNGVTPALCGGNKLNCNGNGSLMRILPMAFVLYPKYGFDLTESGTAMEWIHKISGLTHRHALAESACGIYVNIATRLMDGMELEQAIKTGIADSLQWYRAHSRFEAVEDYWKRIVDVKFLKLFPKAEIHSGGYVVDTLESAFWCLLNTDNYRDCILEAVNLGHDPDTTAAVAGGLAGLYYGYDGIPKDWIDKLAAKGMVEDACLAMADFMRKEEQRAKQEAKLNPRRKPSKKVKLTNYLGMEGEEAIMSMRNTQKDTFPVMTDIHMHIIPGVDDGAWNLEMSMCMIYMAYEQGVRNIIATPHSSSFEEHPELTQITYQELKEKFAKFYPDMKLALGCEVFCRKNTIKYILKNLEEGVFPSMNGTKYVLTEFNTLMDVEEVKFCVTQLLEAGWIPLIAHVERYPRLFRDFKVLEELKQMGCLLQVNVYSVFEENDWGIHQHAISLVEKKMVDFLGSDAHRTFHRPPCVQRGLKYLYETYEKEYVDAIAFENAKKVLLM